MAPPEIVEKQDAFRGTLVLSFTENAAKINANLTCWTKLKMLEIGQWTFFRFLVKGPPHPLACVYGIKPLVLQCSIEGMKVYVL